MAFAESQTERPESVREGGCSADVVTRLVDGTRYVRIDATSATDLTSLLSGLSGPVVLYFALPPAVSMAAWVPPFTRMDSMPP